MRHIKISPGGLILVCKRVKLFDSNFGSGNSLAGEETNTAGVELYDTVFCSVDSKVAADARAFTWALGHADLADDNLTGLNFCATKQLNAKALAGAVVNIFGGTASFDV
jgi:hypothetical protein